MMVVRTKMDVVSELQNWGDMYREELETEAAPYKTVEQCMEVGKKVESLKFGLMELFQYHRIMDVK